MVRRARADRLNQLRRLNKQNLARLATRGPNSAVPLPTKEELRAVAENAYADWLAQKDRNVRVFPRRQSHGERRTPRQSLAGGPSRPSRTKGWQ
jgi:hypothetical protein